MNDLFGRPPQRVVAAAKTKHVFLHLFSLILGREFKGESMKPAVLVADDSCDRQRSRLSGKGEQQGHLRTDADGFGNLCGQAVFANISAARIQHLLGWTMDLKQQAEVRGKARQSITELLHRGFLFFAHVAHGS